jgi:ATP-binding cassette subfamily B protein
MLKEYRTLLPYLREYRWFYIAGILCLVVTSGGQLFIPQFIRVAVDTIVSGDFALSSVGFTMLKLLGVAVIIAVARFGWRNFLHGASRRIEKQLREQLFSHLLTLSPGFYGRTRTGDLMARATNDMRAIRMATGMALVAFIDGIFMTLAIVIILFSQNPRLAVFTIMPLPLIVVLVISMGRMISGLFRKVQEGFSTLSEQSQEAISGIRVIKSFVKEDYFVARFGRANENYKQRNMAYIRVWGLFMPFVTFLSGLTTLLLLRVGGQSVIIGELSAGQFVATLNYLEMLIWPMIGAGMTVNMLARGAASLGRINQILSEEPEITSPPAAIERVESRSFETRGLSFAYPGTDIRVLEDISLEIPEGALVGILGKTGAGKSTLVRLLPRLLDPPAGTVFMGGHDVRDYDVSELRRQFGIVPQDTFLFSTTIRENIAYANPDLDEETIRRVANISTIDRDIGMFPHGWDTQVGERGVTLSGGQKQRIAISRALAVDPPVLIFDDALSAVDTESEERILRELLEYRRGRTNIVIAHRVSTLQRADLILVLEDGKVVQQGTHRDLIAQEGFYQEIYTLQQLEQQEQREQASGGGL